MSYKRKWKFMTEQDGQIKSVHGNMPWEPGNWQAVTGNLVPCQNGLHASDRISEALSWVKGSVIARVEVRGDAIEEPTKSAHQAMRVVSARRWTATDSVALAIYSASLVIEIFEQTCPGDDRPRKAIEAAQAWIDNPGDVAADAAADAAYAARAAANAAADAAARAAHAAANAAADAAARAAHAAAEAAHAAAEAAYAAARAAANAAYAADAAAEAAYAATRAAANANFRDKIERWLVARFRQLEVI